MRMRRVVAARSVTSRSIRRRIAIPFRRAVPILRVMRERCARESFRARRPRSRRSGPCSRSRRLPGPCRSGTSEAGADRRCDRCPPPPARRPLPRSAAREGRDAAVAVARLERGGVRARAVDHASRTILGGHDSTRDSDERARDVRGLTLVEGRSKTIGTSDRLSRLEARRTARVVPAGRAAGGSEAGGQPESVAGRAGVDRGTRVGEEGAAVAREGTRVGHRTAPRGSIFDEDRAAACVGRADEGEAVVSLDRGVALATSRRPTASRERARTGGASRERRDGTAHTFAADGFFFGGVGTTAADRDEPSQECEGVPRAHVRAALQRACPTLRRGVGGGESVARRRVGGSVARWLGGGVSRFVAASWPIGRRSWSIGERRSPRIVRATWGNV
jgi:hypothetical protein